MQISTLSSPETIQSIIGKQDTLEEILKIKDYILKTIDFEVVQYTNDDIINITSFEVLSLLLYNYQELDLISDEILEKNKLLDEKLKKELKEKVSQKFEEVILYTSGNDEITFISYYNELDGLESNRKEYIKKAQEFLDLMNGFINSSKGIEKEKTLEELISEYGIEIDDLSFENIVDNFNIIRKLKDSVLYKYSRDENKYIQNEYEEFIKISRNSDNINSNYIDFIKVLIVDLHKLKN